MISTVSLLLSAFCNDWHNQGREPSYSFLLVSRQTWASYALVSRALNRFSRDFFPNTLAPQLITPIQVFPLIDYLGHDSPSAFLEQHTPPWQERSRIGLAQHPWLKYPSNWMLHGHLWAFYHLIQPHWESWAILACWNTTISIILSLMTHILEQRSLQFDWDING